MEKLSQDIIIMSDMLRDTKHYYAIMNTISKKLINDFPQLTVNLKSVIEKIEKTELMKNIADAEDNFIKSNDFVELASYIQSIGEESVEKLKANSDKLGEVIKDMPDNQHSTLYDVRRDLYAYHEVTVGAILKEVNRMLSIMTPCQV